jgi:autophagy-related protein 9
LGYVCSFAVFDFKNGGNRTAQQPHSRGADGADLRDDYYSTKDGKMLASYFNFMDNYVTNPKPGVPYLHPSRKSHFNPPPTFPGLASSTLMGGMHASSTGRVNIPDRQPRTQSRQRTPRFAPIPNQHSPVTSILLDPQHQPGPSSFKPMNKTGTQSRLRASLKPPAELSEDNEEPYAYQGPHIESAAEAGEVFESNLGESWKTTRAGATDEDDEDGTGGQTASGDKGPGVLGLVYQFSKAHT